MPDVGGPANWPEWCRGYQPTAPASQPRLRVTWDLRFEADDFADGLDLEVWRDNRGRWSVSPKEEQ